MAGLATPFGFPLGASSPLEVRNISPAVDTVVTETTPILFEVVSPSLPLLVVISVDFPSSGISELAYGGTLTAYYSNLQSFATSTVDGWSFKFLRTPKWPGTPLTITIFASDAAGNSLTQALTWTVEQAVVVAPSSSSVSSTVAASTDPLGFGIVRPFRRVPTNDFQTASGATLVRAAVGQVLGTAVGDVPWRPRFGTLLARLRHMRNAQALPVLARISIENALRQWEPRVEVTEVSVEPAVGDNANKVLLSLRYRISNAQADIVRLLV